MRPAHQAFGAALLVAVTAVSIHRIAVARNETAVGGWVDPIDEDHPSEMSAFRDAVGETSRLGDAALGGRLSALQRDGRMYVAGGLGPERWAVYVETLSFVRRVYIRRAALLDPVAHLFEGAAAPAVPLSWQEEQAWLTLIGALRHELAHYDGVLDEDAAYAIEIAWYEERRDTPWLAEAEGEERRAREWALDSALLSARKAQRLAGAPRNTRLPPRG